MAERTTGLFGYLVKLCDMLQYPLVRSEILDPLILAVIRGPAASGERLARLVFAGQDALFQG